jgi:hypothetical protein
LLPFLQRYQLRFELFDELIKGCEWIWKSGATMISKRWNNTLISGIRSWAAYIEIFGYQKSRLPSLTLLPAKRCN